MPITRPPRPIAVAQAVTLGYVLFSPLPVRAQPEPARRWDVAAAARYLDERMAWWMQWPVAARDHGTACVSCHTSVPYALARHALRPALGEGAVAPPEARLLGDVRRRVTLWRDVEPFYRDQTHGLPKTSESRGTEAVLNALVLADRDAADERLSDETRLAFDNLWALQLTRGELAGAWAWLSFDLAPWESEGAAYFGAALAAVAVGLAPEDYAESPELETGLSQLRTYLVRDWEGRPAFDRVMLLWAASVLPGLLMPEQALEIVEDLTGLQGDDGGWRSSSLRGWVGRDGYTPAPGSDGYATGLIAFVLQKAGVARRHATLERAIRWLERNQHPSGRWPASSLNRERVPESDRGLLMADAATAFAVLALTEAERGGRRRGP